VAAEELLMGERGAVCLHPAPIFDQSSDILQSHVCWLL